MKGYKEPSQSGRQVAAEERKKLALEKFRKHTADPALDKRLAERAASGAERAAIRHAAAVQRDRKNARDEALAQEAAEAATRVAEQQRAEQFAREAEQAQSAARASEQSAAAQVANEAERKAARDARYAARKARGRR